MITTRPSDIKDTSCAWSHIQTKLNFVKSTSTPPPYAAILLCDRKLLRGIRNTRRNVKDSCFWAFSIASTLNITWIVCLTITFLLKSGLFRDEHSMIYLPNISQKVPLWVTGHVQEYWPIRSLHVPLFRQGELKHSFTPVMNGKSCSCSCVLLRPFKINCLFCIKVFSKNVLQLLWPSAAKYNILLALRSIFFV